MNIRRKTSRTSSAGFSLAELMVVIVIIGLLATVVVPKVLDRLFTGQQGKAVADITQIYSALNTYAVENSGRYPDSLEALITPDANGISYLDRQTVPKDPWGNEYIYEPPGPGTSSPVVRTYGADGVPGGEQKDRDFDIIMIQNGEV